MNTSPDTAFLAALKALVVAGLPAITAPFTVQVLDEDDTETRARPCLVIRCGPDGENTHPRLQRFAATLDLMLTEEAPNAIPATPSWDQGAQWIRALQEFLSPQSVSESIRATLEPAGVLLTFLRVVAPWSEKDGDRGKVFHLVVNTDLVTL